MPKHDHRRRSGPPNQPIPPPNSTLETPTPRADVSVTYGAYRRLTIVYPTDPKEKPMPIAKLDVLILQQHVAAALRWYHEAQSSAITSGSCQILPSDYWNKLALALYDLERTAKRVL